MKEILRTKYWQLQEKIEKGEIQGIQKIVVDTQTVVYYQNGKKVLMETNGVCLADKDFLKRNG